MIVQDTYPLPPLLETLIANDQVLHVYVELGVHRASDATVTLAGDGMKAAGSNRNFPPNVFLVAIPAGGAKATTLRVRSVGEPVPVVRFFVEKRPGERERQFVLEVDPHGGPADYCPGRRLLPTFQEDHSPWPAGGPPFMGPAEYIATMRDMLADTALPDRAAKSQFFRLDHESHPMLLPLMPNPRVTKKQIGLVFGNIIRRITNRVRLRAKGQPALLGAPSGDMLLALWPIMRLQQYLIEHHFTSLAEYEDGFRKFANGELRMRLPNGMVTTQPSSGYFFLFGEFALTAARAAQDAVDPPTFEFWRAVAAATIGAQPILPQVYQPSAAAAKPSFVDYRACAFTESLAPPDLAHAAPKLPPDTPPDDLSEQAAHNAFRALPGLAP